MQLESRLEHANGRVTGSLQLPPQMGGNKTVDTEVPPGTLLTGMDEYLLAVADLWRQRRR